MKVPKNSLFVFSILISFKLSAKFFSLQEDHWNWADIDYTTITFAKGFLIGTSESATQVEGRTTAQGKMAHNSWTLWEQEEIVIDGVLQPRVPLEYRVTDACQRWYRYKEDIQLLKNLGMNTLRFSLEWSKIEPEKGMFDLEAMQHYIEYVQEMLNNGILPIPTLFHHTLPTWTIQVKKPRRPGFEDQQTIDDFVSFALYVANAFHKAGLLDKIPLWITINEPIAIPLSGYIYNIFPPGKKFRLRRAGIVANNMLKAHCAVYDAFKTLYPSLKIGLTHIMQPIQPYRPWNPLDIVPAKIFDYLVNDVVLEYFKSGKFNWLLLVRDYNPDAPQKLDFLGINYYTHTLISMFKERARPEEKLSEAYDGKKIKTIYPEGLYFSLQKAAQVNVPLLITENGFAYDHEELRDEYIKKHLYVIYKCMQEGMDIRGYLFWTLTDCFGWTSAFQSTHGIYKVNFETQERTLRSSARYLLEVTSHKIDNSLMLCWADHK